VRPAALGTEVHASPGKEITIMKRSAVIGLTALLLLGGMSTALPAQRAVFAEMFGSTW
jgi:hypothetical protein